MAKMVYALPSYDIVPINHFSSGNEWLNYKGLVPLLINVGIVGPVFCLGKQSVILVGKKPS